MTEHDAILFDFDGVLADSEPVHFNCWAEIVRPCGVELTWDLYARECIGLTDTAFLTVVAGLADPPIPLEWMRAQYPRKRQMFLERMLADPPVDEDLIALIKSLRSLRLAVVTSTNRISIEPVLEQVGIRDCFQAVVGGRDVTRHKPHPEPYLVAASLLGAQRPLVVEDSDAGCQSAEAAGFKVLRVSSAHETSARLRAYLGL